MGGAGVGGRLVLLARSFTRGSSEVACGTWLRHSVNHTQVIIANLCGPAPYPALTRIDVMEEAVAVGWLS